jgi:serine/threonine-protein kinase
LAQGGFGATFLAQDKSLPGEPKCVVKQLRPSVKTPEVLQMARELFAREAKTLRKIGNHPQVPRLLDYFEDNQQFYLVQEYISGLTLQQEVKGFGPFSEAGVKQFLSEFLPTLQEIHDQKVIHRDIKPANLIRRSEDRKLVLIDFGAVKDQVTQTVTSFLEGQTAFTAFAVGTRGFAPPEQIALRPVYASDIYALGVTCIYLLSSKSPQELNYNPSTGEILWENKVQVSDFLRKVLKKMLEGSVRQRYQSATEVLKALELEPYLDSLAKSMSAQPSNRLLKGPSDGSSAPSIIRMAAEIRALRSRLAEANNEQTEITQKFDMKTTATTLKTSGSTGPNPKVIRKLDSHGLLTAYFNGKRNFAERDLSLLNLQQANLSAAKFCSSKLDKTNLQKASLFSSDFSRASLNRANLREANLSKADLNHADLEEADLRGADLSYADLGDANLRGANLCGANLSKAKVSDQQLESAKTNWMTVRPNSKRGLL